MELSAALLLIRHQRLLTPPAACWADLGCGSGLFTTALSRLLPEGSTVYAVDKNRRALSLIPLVQRTITVQKILADFTTEDLSLPPLNGILMANALHYVPHQDAFLARARKWLKVEGCFLLVEYDTNLPNQWVPYPLPFSSLARLFTPLGFRSIEKLGERPSVYQSAPMYAALICP